MESEESSVRPWSRSTKDWALLRFIKFGANRCKSLRHTCNISRKHWENSQIRKPGFSNYSLLRSITLWRHDQLANLGYTGSSKSMGPPVFSQKRYFLKGYDHTVNNFQLGFEWWRRIHVISRLTCFFRETYIFYNANWNRAKFYVQVCTKVMWSNGIQGYFTALLNSIKV